ncbi:MAG TPA: acyl carrier protein [Micromonosporaceae bacterium]
MVDLDQWIAEILELPAAEITDDLGPATYAGWTSLRHVQVISAVQRRYGVRVPPREARAIRSVGDLRRWLIEAGVAP